MGRAYLIALTFTVKILPFRMYLLLCEPSKNHSIRMAVHVRWFCRALRISVDVYVRRPVKVYTCTKSVTSYTLRSLNLQTLLAAAA